MAIAEGILDIVLDYATQAKAQKVNMIQLHIGEMTGVEPDALQFCFSILTKGTMAENATLSFEHVPIVVECEACGKESSIKQHHFVCPFCRSYQLKMISGRELQVAYLEVD